MRRKRRPMLNFEANQLFVHAPLAYSVLDSEGRHIAANERFWELFRYPPETPLTVAEITHSDSQDHTAEYLRELRSGAREKVVVKKQYVRSDKTVFWGRLTASRLVLESGEVLLLGLLEDIDDQHRVEEQLRAAAADQSEFVARVSHELRNPLHTIAGLAELLSTADIDPSLRHQASIVLRETTNLSSIVSDLLDIGRFDSGTLEVETEPFALRSVIDRSVRSAQAPAAAKALRVLTYVDDALPLHVEGSPGRLGQVIDNLVGNAIKFTVEGSVGLEVRTTATDVVEFRVVDTGPGIPAERRSEVFQPFQRLNPSAPGAGLGLAISARLAASMGGTIELVESGPEGSTFELRLPLPAVESPKEERDRSVAPPEGRHQRRILVVEDNPETQMLAGAQLDRLGYEHEIVGNGFDALERSASVAFDAILMDWHLPGIDGLETTRRIRQREDRQGRTRVPIISVTARAMADDIEACIAAGADDFVAKPAGIDQIAEVLDRWTGAGGPAGGSADAVAENPAFAALLDDLGDPSIVASLARTFLQELPGRVATIVAAGDDLEAAQLAAHTLKSTSAMVGAEALRAIAAEIEESNRSGRSASAADHARLEDVAATTRDEVLAQIEHLEAL